MQLAPMRPQFKTFHSNVASDFTHSSQPNAKANLKVYLACRMSVKMNIKIGG